MNDDATSRQTAEEVPARAVDRAKRLQPKGGSRKGCPNKVTKTIKVELLASFDMVGGREYLAKQAIENPHAYMNLLGKLVPQELRAEVNGGEGLTVVVQQLVCDPGPDGCPGVINAPDPRWIDKRYRDRARLPASPSDVVDVPSSEVMQ